MARVLFFLKQIFIFGIIQELKFDPQFSACSLITPFKIMIQRQEVL